MATENVSVTIGARDKTGPATKSAYMNFRRLTMTLLGYGGVTWAWRRTGAQVLKTGMEFEQAIKTVQVLTGSFGDQAKALEETARELGKTTVFTARQAADAMKNLARAGFTAKEITDSIGGAMSLAAATGENMTKATYAVSTVLRQFGLDASKSGKLADIFTEAVNNSHLTLTTLASSMKYAGTVGASFGESVESTVAAVAMLTKMGVEGSQAGRYFRMALQQAAKGMPRQIRVLEKYGLTFEQINPAVNSFSDILKTVGKVGMTTADAVVVFGGRAGGAIANMSAQVEQGVLDFDGFVDQLTNSMGAAEETAGEMLDTLAGDWRLFISALEERMLQLYEVASPFFREFTQGATHWMRNGIAALQDVNPSEVPWWAAPGAGIAAWSNLLPDAGDTDLEKSQKDQEIRLKQQKEMLHQLEATEGRYKSAVASMHLAEKELAEARQRASTLASLGLSEQAQAAVREAEAEVKKYKALSEEFKGQWEFWKGVRDQGGGGQLMPAVDVPGEGPDGENKESPADRRRRQRKEKLKADADELTEHFRLLDENYATFTGMVTDNYLDELVERVTKIQEQYNEMLKNPFLSQDMKNRLEQMSGQEVADALRTVFGKMREDLVQSQAEVQRILRKSFTDEMDLVHYHYRERLADQSMTQDERLQLLKEYLFQANALIAEFRGEGLLFTDKDIEQELYGIRSKMNGLRDDLVKDDHKWAEAGVRMAAQMVDGFKSVMNSERDEMRRVAARFALQTLGALIQLASGGHPAGTFIGSVVSTSANLFHDGGMVRKAHNGAYISNGKPLAPYEVPIIAKDGEGILNDYNGMPAIGGRAGLDYMNKFGRMPGQDGVNLTIEMNAMHHEVGTARALLRSPDFRREIRQFLKEEGIA